MRLVFSAVHADTHVLINVADWRAVRIVHARFQIASEHKKRCVQMRLTQYRE